MSGMNLFFHVASAVAAVFLVWRALRLRGERDLLRLLLGSGLPAAARGAAGRVVVDAPGRWLQAVAGALGVPCEGAGAAGAPARIEPGPVFELLSTRGLALVRWTAPAAVELHVRAASGAADDATVAARLGAALGGALSVRVVTAGLPGEAPPG